MRRLLGNVFMSIMISTIVFGCFGSRSVVVKHFPIVCPSGYMGIMVKPTAFKDNEFVWVKTTIRTLNGPITLTDIPGMYLEKGGIAILFFDPNLVIQRCRAMDPDSFVLPIVRKEVEIIFSKCYDWEVKRY